MYKRQIPDKGRILTSLSKWWFTQLEGVVPNHVSSGRIPKAVAGRAMVCERLEMIPVECVVRGYLAGSGLTEYLATGSICGNGLPPGLKDGSELPKHLFTPATKAALGEHDVNVTYDEVIVAINTSTPRLSSAVCGFMSMPPNTTVERNWVCLA